MNRRFVVVMRNRRFGRFTDVVVATCACAAKSWAERVFIGATVVSVTEAL